MPGVEVSATISPTVRNAFKVQRRREKAGCCPRERGRRGSLEQVRDCAHKVGGRGTYTSQTAVDWGSIAARRSATHSPTELRFASNFNIFIYIQECNAAMLMPNGSLCHTRVQEICVTAR